MTTQSGEGGGDAVLVGISAEKEKGHLLSFSTLFFLGGDFCYRCSRGP